MASSMTDRLSDVGAGLWRLFVSASWADVVLTALVSVCVVAWFEYRVIPRHQRSQLMATLQLESLHRLQDELGRLRSTLWTALHEYYIERDRDSAPVVDFIHTDYLMSVRGPLQRVQSDIEAVAQECRLLGLHSEATELLGVTDQMLEVEVGVPGDLEHALQVGHEVVSAVWTKVVEERGLRLGVDIRALSPEGLRPRTG